MFNAQGRGSGFASMSYAQNPDEQDTLVSRSENVIVAEIVGKHAERTPAERA